MPRKKQVHRKPHLLPDGRWRVITHVWIGRDPVTRTQRQHQHRAYGDTEEEAVAAAEKWVADQRAKLAKGEHREPVRLTLATWGRRWLEGHRDRVKRSTWTGYDGVFRTLIEAPTDARMPRLGTIPMERLKAVKVRALYEYLCKTPNGRGEINRGRAKTLHAVLRQIFRDAFNEDAVPEDLLPKLRRVIPRDKKRRKGRRAFTAKQLEAFLRAANDDPYRAFWFLYVVTGARPGELLALRWPALDLEAHAVHITQTLHRVWHVPEDQRWEFTDAKTENADRKVVFPAELVPMLREHKKQQDAAIKRRKRVTPYADLVFQSRTGSPIEWVNFTKRYQQICARAELGTYVEPLSPGAKKAKRRRFVPLLSPYHLRHTNATVLREGGVPLHVITDRLGHAKPSFTDDTYPDPHAGSQQPAVDVWSQWLRKTGTNA